MNEMTTTYQFFLALLGLSVASFAYMLGGREKGPGKWIRRFVGSFILACVVNGLCAWRGLWSPWMLITYPLLAVGFSMGYGDKGVGGYVKFVRRLLYALGVLSAGVLMTVTIGGAAWAVLLPHIGVGLWSIWMGYKNPLEASGEEGFICVALNLGLICYPFINS